MNNQRYSPLPVEDYFVSTKCKPSIQVISELEIGDAIWNLLYLSNPDVDLIPENEAEYVTNRALQDAIVTDVYEDEVLYRKLLMPIGRFIAWFQREDHTIYDAYNVGGEHWVSTVLKRAAAVAERQAPVVSKRDNVIQVKFGKAA